MHNLEALQDLAKLANKLNCGSARRAIIGILSDTERQGVLTHLGTCIGNAQPRLSIDRNTHLIVNICLKAHSQSACLPVYLIPICNIGQNTLLKANRLHSRSTGARGCKNDYLAIAAIHRSCNTNATRRSISSHDISTPTSITKALNLGSIITTNDSVAKLDRCTSHTSLATLDIEDNVECFNLVKGILQILDTLLESIDTSINSRNLRVDTIIDRSNSIGNLTIDNAIISGNSLLDSRLICRGKLSLHNVDTPRERSYIVQECPVDRLDTLLQQRKLSIGLGNSVVARKLFVDPRLHRALRGGDSISKSSSVGSSDLSITLLNKSLDA